MYQLRNLVHRTSVPTDPQKNMNSTEYFLLLLLHTHTIAAANRIQSLLSLTSVTELARSIVVNFIRLPVLHSKEKPQKVKDGVYVYAVELLTLTLFWHGFRDDTKEGDGDRILRYCNFCWFCSKARLIETMQKRLSMYYFSITTFYQRDKGISCYGVDV